ncbi:uncharacterized protein LOC143913618 [Arctopsyche grandis]|uniref:uncharacterized protein LOC143913618 n=1 Tax=Arctopsyche grandis TaxID=121162 RepID=UPI00406D9FC2
MECRLCRLCSARPEAFVSIHDDPHPQHLVQRIWTCCQLRVRKDDRLPDMICLSCVNNLELLDSFRNACLQSDKTSRIRSDECLDIKVEEVLLEDLIWEKESGADFPPNISNWQDDGETRGGNIISDDKVIEIKYTIGIPAEEVPLRDDDPTYSELDHKMNFQDKLLTLVTPKTSQTRIKPYKCDNCTNKFTTKQGLSLHMNVHTEIKPHFRSHMQNHSGKKPFKCDICLKSFTYEFSFNKHMKIHSGGKPFQCDTCLQSFTYEFSFSKHMKIHSGGKPFQCDICLKSFIYKSSFSKHMKIHSGVKPHECDICLRSFTYEFSFLKHMKIHSGGKTVPM